MKRFVIIDGNALVHRAYHALPRLTNKKGELINAVYGFILVFLKAIRELKPDYMAVTFDLAAPTFRHKEYEEYKAKRPKAPQELYDQLDRVKEVVRAFNIPICEQEGYEADDVIGTIAHQQKGKNIETIIVTGDLDTLQLVDKQTKVYTFKRGINDSVLYGEDEVIKRYSLVPEQLVDFKGLRGDPSDNIPGAPGIGEKTATKLLKEFETLENLYRAIEKKPKIINLKLAEKLIQFKEQVFFSKYLATIKKDVPLQIDFEKYSLANYDYQKVVDLFKKLNFHALIARLPSEALPGRQTGLAKECLPDQQSQTPKPANSQKQLNLL